MIYLPHRTHELRRTSTIPAPGMASLVIWGGGGGGSHFLLCSFNSSPSLFPIFGGQQGKGGGAEKNSLLRHTALFLQASREGGGVRKIFPYTYIQNFVEMWMFLAEWSVHCIESKHDK